MERVFDSFSDPLPFNGKRKEELETSFSSTEHNLHKQVVNIQSVPFGQEVPLKDYYRERLLLLSFTLNGGD